MGKRKEIWKRIPGYSGDYHVSNMGRVISYKRNSPKILKPIRTRDGYLKVHLSKNAAAVKKPIHRLVLLSFVGPDSKGVTRHLNGNRKDNSLKNLKYGTAKENYGDRILHGTSCDGERHGRAVLSSADVFFIRKNCVPGNKKFGLSALARKYKVAPSTISAALQSKSWAKLGREGKNAKK